MVDVADLVFSLALKFTYFTKVYLDMIIKWILNDV